MTIDTGTGFVPVDLYSLLQDVLYGWNDYTGQGAVDWWYDEIDVFRVVNALIEGGWIDSDRLH